MYSYIFSRLSLWKVEYILYGVGHHMISFWFSLHAAACCLFQFWCISSLITLTHLISHYINLYTNETLEEMPINKVKSILQCWVIIEFKMKWNQVYCDRHSSPKTQFNLKKTFKKNWAREWTAGLHLNTISFCTFTTVDYLILCVLVLFAWAQSLLKKRYHRENDHIVKTN